MPIRCRKAGRIGEGGRRLTISKGGLSLSQQIGPAAISTSGHQSLRIGPAVTLFKSGQRKRRR
jgi:hypothetical protein